MLLTGHQFTRTSVFAFSPSAAQEASMVQEKAQQIKVLGA
jgi:hypothetical protein